MERIDLEVDAVTPPPAAQAFAQDAAARSAPFVAKDGDQRVPALVTSNHHLAYAALRRIADEALAPGRRFVEWGSGTGVVAATAAMLGFEAHAIERERSLVELARQLCVDHGVDVAVHQGSYSPPGAYDESVDPDVLDAELGFAPTEFDVIYAYPWPAEERVVFWLFANYAPSRSLLVTFHGGADLRVHRQAG